MNRQPHVQVTFRQRSKRWCVRERRPGGQTIARLFRDRDEAEGYAAWVRSSFINSKPSTGGFQP